MTGADILPDAYESNGLLALGSAGANVFTGTPDGPINITVEIHTSAPPLALDGWEDVVEVSQWTDSGNVGVVPPFTVADPTIPALEISPESWYRVRVHAQGRDAGNAHVTGPAEAVEEHLVQMWPAAQAPEQVHRMTSEYGLMMRETH
ncbi:MAG: hypothetical protein H0T78_04130 [Longispora sp.]|nr:hypothetical protein [Longispora sp. (in: high G+C Gram-positive bacteria)]